MKKVIIIAICLLFLVGLSGCIEDGPPLPPQGEETYLDQIQNQKYIGCYFVSSETAFAQGFIPTYPTLDYLDLMICRGGVKTDDDTLIIEIRGALDIIYPIAPLIYRAEFPAMSFAGSSNPVWEQLSIAKSVTPGHSYYIVIYSQGDYSGYTFGCMNQNLYPRGEFYRSINNMASWFPYMTSDLTFRTWGH